MLRTKAERMWAEFCNRPNSETAQEAFLRIVGRECPDLDSIERFDLEYVPGTNCEASQMVARNDGEWVKACDLSSVR